MIRFDPQTISFFQKQGSSLLCRLTCTVLPHKQVLVLNHIFINPQARTQSRQLSLALVKAALKFAQSKQLQVWPLGPATITAMKQISAAQTQWYHKPIK